MTFRQLKENEQEKNSWNEFALSHNFGHLFQTYDWGEVSRELGWCPLRLLVEDKDKILAIAQILKRKKGPFSILYIPRGPIFSNSESFHFLSANLTEVIKRENAILCKINPAIDKQTATKELYEYNSFVKSSFREMHICSYRINLSQDLNNIWNNFRGSVRTSIRKAEKSGVAVDDSDSAENLNSFYKIYSDLSVKGKTTTHSYKFLKAVWERFIPKKQIKILTAYFEGRPIATELLFLYSKIGELMWISNVRLDNDLGASQLIHWKIINWLKENGFLFYDLGGVPPNKNELPGIHFHKQSLGGDFVELAGEFELAGSPLLYFFWSKFGRLYINRNRPK